MLYNIAAKSTRHSRKIILKIQAHGTKLLRETLKNIEQLAVDT